MAKLNLLDRAIGWAAPQKAAGRLAARARIEGITRATALYDGAARTHRTAGRQISTSDANSEILYSLGRLRDVSRDLGRNNPYAARAVAGIASNVVGTGIIPSVTGAKAREKKALQRLIREHLDTTDIDLKGRNNLYGIQALAVRTVVESGEALIVRYLPEASLGLKVPLQVRVLEPDYLDPNKQGTVGSDGNICFQGIEFDRRGRRVAYWLYPEHPYGVSYRRFGASQRVPAEDVIHLYRVDRADQERGIPWAAPVVMTTWDLGDYEDAELMRQKIAACFAVFWIDGGDGAAQFQGGEGQSQGGNPVDMLEPGMVQRLTGGTDVKFATPPVTQGYSEYTRTQIRKIAVGYGVPAELLSNDLSQVNFSSGRLGWLEFQRSIDLWRWHMLIPHLCVGVGRWFLEAATVALNGPTTAGLDWTPPRREMIKPSEDIAAARDAVRAGFSSRSEEQRKFGHDPEVIEGEIAEDNRRADATGTKFDSDGRFPMNAALPPPTTPQSDPDGTIQPAR